MNGGRGVNAQGIVFDLDDTLLDHRGSATAALRSWLPTLAESVSNSAEVLDDLITAWFVSEERHFADWRAARITFQEMRHRRMRDLRDALGLDVGRAEPTIGELDATYHGYAAAYQDNWAPFADVAPALAALHAAGMPMVVLTNGSGQMQNAKVDVIGVRRWLRAVVTAEDVGVPKPDPAAYQAACDRLGLDAADCVHVGDRHDLDVLAARAAGLAAIHLDRTGGEVGDEPHRVTTLTELPGLLV